MRSLLHRRAIAEHVRGCFIGNETFFPDDRPGARPAVPPTVGAGASPGIIFGGIATPSTDFQAVRDQRRTTPLWFLVDLSTARSIAAGTAAVLNLQGNTFYADPVQDASGNNAAGYATIHFADTSLNPQGTPLTVGPQFIAKVPFTQLLLENIAQAGKFLRIIYGVDIDFSPGLNASVTIGGVVTVAGTLGTLAQVLLGGVNTLQTTDRGYTAGANFASSTAIGAATNETIVAPASNTNGLILWGAGIDTYTTAANSGSQVGMLAKTSAPASAIDGELLLTVAHDIVQVQSGSAGNRTRRERARFVAAGKGLYFRNSGAAEAQGYRWADYTLL
jgi:hypothetical protein